MALLSSALQIKRKTRPKRVIKHAQSQSTEEVVEMEEELMLTTIDNPWNPFTHFREWYTFDMLAGYNSCGYLARIAHTSPDLSEFDEREEINRAIREIVHYNFSGMHQAVTEKDWFDKRPEWFKRTHSREDPTKELD